MSGTTPKQAIIDYLAQPEIVITPQHVTADGVLHGATGRGGMDAQPETFQFLKSRSIPGWQLHAVSYTTRKGMRMFFMASVRQNDDGTWHFEGGGGGGLYADTTRWSQPRANLCGLKGNSLVSLGGYVHDNGLGVVQVRLRSANGMTLRDTVEDGIVLFLSDQPFAPPIQAELYDNTGTLVGGHTVWRDHP